MDGVMRRLGCLLAGFAALAVCAGCSGRTTGVSQITEHPDGSYSATLNAIGSCSKGSSATPCTAYMRWREVGNNAWTKGPPINAPVKVSNRLWSQTATGLSPGAEYEYQACGNEFDEKVVCAGPDGTPGTSEKFTAGLPRDAASAPGQANDDSNASEGDGTGPLAPILIAAGAVALLLGGAWWARRSPPRTSAGAIESRLTPPNRG